MFSTFSTGCCIVYICRIVSVVSSHMAFITTLFFCMALRESDSTHHAPLSIYDVLLYLITLNRSIWVWGWFIVHGQKGAPTQDCKVVHGRWVRFPE